MSNPILKPAKPTALNINKNDHGEMLNGRITDAVILYARLQDGEAAFGEEAKTQYATQLAVTEETARNWASVFPKNTPKRVDNEQFIKSFKIDPPFPHQQEQHILRLKSNMHYARDNQERGIKAGDLVPYEDKGRPKLYEIIDGKAVDVTMEKQPANGTIGHVGFRIVKNEKFGTFPVLAGIVATELIEAEKRNQFADMYGIEVDEIVTATPNVTVIPAEQEMPTPVAETGNTYQHEPVQQPVAQIQHQSEPEPMDFSSSDDVSFDDLDF